MATQGIVSIAHDGKTVIKVIAGCNGYNADALADEIRQHRLTDVSDIQQVALTVGFGCPECLVVMDKDSIIADCSEDLSPRYRETFADPNFNPRWDYGTAEHVAIINI